MNAICCVCQQQLSKEADKKNIFKDGLVIRSNYDKTAGTCKSFEKIKIYSAIELITGHKTVDPKGSSSVICEQCFQKLEGFINFRAQLLSSSGIIFHGQISSFSSSIQKCFEIEIEKSQNSLKKNDMDYLIGTSDCPKLPVDQLVSDDLINVDENSDSLDLTTIRNDDDKNDSTNCYRLQNNSKNNNLIDSDSSNDNIDVQNCDDSPTRVFKNDIESDIDVCSGEDDEILEIENKRGKHSIQEVQNNSDSDIEVCDYEPIGKRMKNCNALSQPLISEL